MGSPLHAPQPAWPARELPVVDGPVWGWEVSGIEQLAKVRAAVRHCVDRTPDGPPAHSPAGERLLLAVEELTSNALRHGAPPVRTAVTADTRGWLLVVSDAAGETPPVEAVDRDPALGGLGLRLTSILASAHGWVTEDDRKHVWAYLPHDPGDPPPAEA